MRTRAALFGSIILAAALVATAPAPPAYEEAATALLSPEVRTLDVLVASPTDRTVPGRLPLPQSFLLAWPQVAVLLSVIILLFAGGLASFLRQEIRA